MWDEMINVAPASDRLLSLAADFVEVSDSGTGLRFCDVQDTLFPSQNDDVGEFVEAIVVDNQIPLRAGIVP